MVCRLREHRQIGKSKPRLDRFSASPTGQIILTSIDPISHVILFVQPLVDVERVIAKAKKPLKESSLGPSSGAGGSAAQEDIFWPG